MTPKAKAPRHLSASTRKWFDGVTDSYDLEPHHVRLLTLAAEAFDRAVQARETLEREGLTFTDRFGAPKAHPAAGIERDSRVAFARLLRELGLDVAAPDSPRPPIAPANHGLRR